MILIELAKKCYRHMSRWVSYQCKLRRGKRIFDLYVKDLNKTRYFIFSHGIGDVVWACSFINAYLKKHPLRKELCCICASRDIEIIRSYIENARFIGVGIKELGEIGHYASKRQFSDDNVLVVVYPPLKRKMAYDLWMAAQIGLEMDICYKYGCFDLDNNDAFEKPDLKAYEDEADQIIVEKNIDVGKSVYLIPYVNSRLNLPIDFWERLSKKLAQEGFRVYTNVGRQQEKSIKGTEAICTRLEVFPLLIKKTGCVISGRCGLGDWVFVNECDTIILHAFDQGNTDISEIWSGFARKESFAAKKERCGLEGKLAELRFNRELYGEDELNSVILKVKEILQ